LALAADLVKVVFVLGAVGGENFLGTHFSLARFVVLLFKLFEVLFSQLLFIDVDVKVLELLVNQLITQSFLR
jgi:hypothetical protein